MTEYKNDLEKWESNNIFLKDQEFSQMQLSLVPIKILSGCFETYITQISPPNNTPWLHVLLLPGTAFKFPNQLNAQYTAKSLLSIFQIKNIPAKIYTISHRLNPIYPQALTDTVDMLKIIAKDKSIKQMHILTWSAGCCHLKQVIEVLQKAEIKVQQLVMVSPVPDLSNRKREKCPDFLNEDFFVFVEKVYCGSDLSKVQKLSLLNSVKEQREKHFLISYPISIVYGSEQYIRQDIEELIKQVNEKKKAQNLDKIEEKCFLGQNHALYSFVTTKQTRQNVQAIQKIAATKWQVSKHVADLLVKKHL